MVAAGNQGRACGRAERGGVELRVAQSRFRDPVHGRCRDHAAKGAGNAIALVVGHDEEHVGRAFRRHDCWRPIRFGIDGGVLDHAAKLRVGRRELFPVNRSGGAGRTGRAGGLDLGQDGRRDRHQDGREHPAQEDMRLCFHDLVMWIVVYGPYVIVSFVKCLVPRGQSAGILPALRPKNG